MLLLFTLLVSYMSNYFMKYTLKEISNILKSPIVDGLNKENNIITNFEYQAIHINCIETAFISISSKSWKKFLGRDSKLKSGEEQLNKKIKNIGLIITEEYISDMENKIPQVIVEDCIEALKLLATTIRNNYNNPIIAITGSMGKSSTRLMLAETLKDFKVLENRANSNTRIALLLQMCKIASNPDFAIFEVSLNAINNRGNISLILKPDIAILTGIGAAHLSTLNSEMDIATYKSRIFYGLSESGTAIINQGTTHSEILIKNAQRSTGNIRTYSFENNSEALKIVNYSIKKGFIDINLAINDEMLNYNLSSISKGMLENSLAVALCLYELNVDVHKCLSYLSKFKPFKKVLEIKEIKSRASTVTLIDDTHNASLPAMINAIEAFNSQCIYYKGKKVIAIGKISDLGDQTKIIHKKLIKYIENSNADKILCLDDETRVIVNKVKSKDITWYNDEDLLLKDLIHLADKDSLILMKSSVTNTQFPKIAQKLPIYLEKTIGYTKSNVYKNRESYHKKSLIKICNKTNEIVDEDNASESATISGLAPILYFIHAKNKKMKNKEVKINDWPTNDLEFYTGKKLTVNEIINSMSNSPHPSLIYQLTTLLFATEKERQEFVKKTKVNYELANSSLINLTGRYRKKERQSFSVHDLYKIYLKNKNILLENHKRFVFGDQYKHGIIDKGDYTFIFTFYKDDELSGFK